MTPKKTKQAPYFPAFLNLSGKKCVVVGGGKIALRKAKLMLECQADVRVISPTLHPDLAKLARKEVLRWVHREYRQGDLKGAAIAIAATDVKEINDRVAREAKRSGTFVNVVDDPGPSDLIVPSSLRRKELVIAISTGGKSPALAKKIRTTLERTFGKEYAPLLSLIGEVRSELKGRGIVVGPVLWQRALDLDRLSKLLKSRERKRAKLLLLKNLGLPKRSYQTKKLPM